MVKIFTLIVVVLLNINFSVAFTLSLHKKITEKATLVLHKTETVKELMDVSTIGDKGEAWLIDGSHFDNCAWDESIAWMKKYHKKAVQSAISYRVDGYEEEERREIFNSLGYIIHTSEDFYSHSNWIDTHNTSDYAKLGVKSITKPSNWFSGVWKGDPSNNCAEGTPTHEQMNKDRTTSVGFSEASTDAVMEVKFQLKEFEKALIDADGIKNARETLNKLGLYTKKSVFTSAMLHTSNSKMYFFKKGNRYSRYDFVNNKTDYTLNITDSFEGVSPIASDIQASFIASDKKAYFFSKNKFIRYDVQKDKADKNYPKSISFYNKNRKWHSNIDAIVQYPNSTKVYIFKEEEYVRYDFAKDKVDDGYPKIITEYWAGLDAFSEGIDAVVLSPKKDKVFFFKNDHYIRYDIKKDKADEGYPKLISSEWKGL